MKKYNLSKKSKLIIYYIIAVLFAFLVYYIALPPLNFCSKGFWAYLIFISVLGIIPFAGKIERQNSKANMVSFKPNKLILVPIIIIGLLIVTSIGSSSLFNAKAYSSVIEVKEAVFKDDMPETENVSNIALMDTQTAQIIGQRQLGSLSDVVSQYEISMDYNQINYKNTPQKVAMLEYGDFFKWINNRSRGIPGYVMVDPVLNTAQYKSFTTAVKYSPSGYFGDKLLRKLRFSYPTKIFDEPRYEIDEDGNPVYVVACLKPNAFLFGAKDVNEVIIFNPCDGTSEIKKIGEIPSWVDIVYNGNLATEKYNWYGTLSGGFINSVFGNQGCKKTTADFGYLVFNDDVWYFTGVTSVNSDESNIGFILTNARTGEYKYYPVIGAEEYSAMGAAQGEVQEKGYIASFPSLINVSGQATYILVLKDANSIVKLYALVNVEKYNIVATGTTQQEAMTAYKKLLLNADIIDTPEDNDDEIEIVVTDINERVVNGNTVIYFKCVIEGNTVLFKIGINEDESAVLVKIGDTLKVKYANTDIEGIYKINEFSIV